MIDGNYETFYDGVDADDETPGYVMFDLGGEKEIAAFSYAPRNGFSDRMIGAEISGSVTRSTAHLRRDQTTLYITEISTMERL